MKKVININFQGRVIPIEEAAYDMLKRYVESLRVFFATEEGRDEIINDIEGRIAELFGEQLKKGSTCITEDDVNSVISSMGRPEDFEADEAKVHSQLGGEQSSYQERQQAYENTGSTSASDGKRLYRDENHKVIAGVCSGIANYFGIDPVVVRIIVILTLGVTLIPYLILWVAVPSSASVVIGSQRKRLFRDPDNKFIAGVCSGLSQYFALNVWIPRVLFLLPFISFAFRFEHWGPWDFPNLLSFSFSPSALFVYIILWIVVPEAKSAADKLEMKGEKVDLNNIKTTIQSDLDGFKDRAKEFSSEFRDKAQEFGESFGRKSRQMSGEAGTAVRRGGRGFGHVIATIAKIFAYFVAGCILFSIVVMLFGLGIFLTSLLPLKGYLLADGWQNVLAWATLILFIWVPVVGIITFIIRRLSRKRGNSTAVRTTFFALWLIGICCFVALIASIRSDFRYRNAPVEQNVPLTNPMVNKLEVRVAPFGHYYEQNWLNFEPFGSVDADTVFARNIRVRVVKSPNDSFQVTMVKLTNGATRSQAEDLARQLRYNVVQRDSSLILDKGIPFTREQKFRNQQVIVTIAVPIGKRIYLNDNVSSGNNVSFFGDSYWDWENDMNSRAYNWDRNVEYVMTKDGLHRTDNKVEDSDNSDNTDDGDNNDGDDKQTLEQFRKSKEQLEREKQQKQKELQEIDRELHNAGDSTRYHYRPDTSAPAAPAAPQPKQPKVTASNAVETVAPSSVSNMLVFRMSI